MLFSIGMAITHFYKFERPVAETSEEELQTLKNALRDRLFQNYYLASSEDDDEELSLKGYKTYIEKEFASDPIIMQKYLDILADESFIEELQPNFMLGGRKKLRNIRTLKKYIRKNKQRITKKLLQKKHTIKKRANKKITRKANKNKKIRRTRRNKV